MDKKTTSLNIVSFSSMQDTSNPDILPFEAVLGYVDTPTDATPCGGYPGYKTVLGSEDIDIESLVGSGVNVRWDYWPEDNMTGHNPRFKVGVIDEAHLEGTTIKAKGHLWRSDFPDVCEVVENAKESLGFSVEIYSDGVTVDHKQEQVTCKGVHFTGASILYKSKAAFRQTSIMCSILDTEGENDMNEEVKQALEAQEKKFTEAIDKLTNAVQALSEQKKEEEPAEEAKAPEAEADNKQDFSAMGEAISKAIADGFAGLKQELSAKVEAPKAENEPERKTVQNLESEAQLANKEKTAMELSAEINKDDTLTPGQKWSKQLALWNAHRDEFESK